MGVNGLPFDVIGDIIGKCPKPNCEEAEPNQADVNPQWNGEMNASIGLGESRSFPQRLGAAPSQERIESDLHQVPQPERVSPLVSPEQVGFTPICEEP